VVVVVRRAVVDISQGRFYFQSERNKNLEISVG
jgi:hypothetical protein